MSYQVWTKDEFEGWRRKDCADLGEAQAEILAALKRGAEPLLTVEVPFDVSINIEELPAEKRISAKEKYKMGITLSKKEGEDETAKGKTEPDKGPGTKSEGEVRPGALDSVPELG